MSAPLSIIVYSDVICPWCYVGKRRLEAALDGPDVPAKVSFAWRPFELNPDMPAEGITRAEYRMRKFGAERAAELDRNMTETGREVGIDFAFDRMQRTPNTRLAHRLIWEAGRQGRQNAIVNRLFRAYFEEALDIGSPDVLTRLASEAGLDAAGVAQALDRRRQPRRGGGAGAAGLPHGHPGRAVLHPARQIRRVGRAAAGILARGAAQDRRRSKSAAPACRPST